MGKLPKKLPFSGLREGETNWAGKGKKEMDKRYCFKLHKGKNKLETTLKEFVANDMAGGDFPRRALSEGHGFYLYETDDIDILLIPYFGQNDDAPNVFEYHYRNRKNEIHFGEFIENATIESVLRHLKSVEKNGKI